MIDFTNMRDGQFAFIISAQRQDAGYQANRDACDELRLTLAKRIGLDVIGFLPCQGCYKGEPEPSFLVFATGRELPHKLRDRFQQESVLIVDDVGEGSLHYSGTQYDEPIGYARWTDCETAQREHDAYTIVTGFNDALVFE